MLCTMCAGIKLNALARIKNFRVNFYKILLYDASIVSETCSHFVMYRGMQFSVNEKEMCVIFREYFFSLKRIQEYTEQKLVS